MVFGHSVNTTSTMFISPSMVFGHSVNTTITMFISPSMVFGHSVNLTSTQGGVICSFLRVNMSLRVLFSN